jgi:hypothetical protein
VLTGALWENAGTIPKQEPYGIDVVLNQEEGLLTNRPTILKVSRR